MDGKPPTVDGMDKNNKFSSAFKKFISKCLVKDPQKRLSASELLNMEFIKKNLKDRQFMIQHFVRHIKKIQIKQCHEHDLPMSCQSQQRQLFKKKSTKYEVNIEPPDEKCDDNDEENEDFNFSTSLHIDELENDNDDDDDDDDNDNGPTQTKGKFTVTTIPNKETQTKSKFTVTEVNGNDNKPAVQKKSRFQVTQVDDDK
eukprot:552309_1